MEDKEEYFNAGKLKNINCFRDRNVKVETDQLINALADFMIHKLYVGEGTADKEEDYSTDDNEDSEEDDDDLKIQKSLEILRLIFKKDKKGKAKKATTKAKTTAAVPPPATKGTSPVLKFKDGDGIYYCPECNWSDKDNSFENFLAHCRTTSHKNKMKNRFVNPKEQAAEEKKKNVDRPCHLNNELSVEKKAGKLESKPEGGAVPKAMQERLIPSTSKENINCGKQKDAVKKAAGSNQNQFLEVNNSPGLMYIETDSKNEYKCTLCDKVIPSALKFFNLMNNVFIHVQGDPHKRKLEETTGPKTLENDKKNDSQYKFLCVLCNHFGSTTCAYASHTQSVGHAKAALKSEEAIQHGLLCVGCDRFLCGSITAINRHYKKCCKKN